VVIASLTSPFRRANDARPNVDVAAARPVASPKRSRHEDQTMPNRTTHQNQGDKTKQGQHATRMSDESKPGSRSQASSDRDMQDRGHGNNQGQERDAQGRFTDDDNNSQSRSSRGGNQGSDNDRPRDAQGRFTDDDDGQQSRSTRGGRGNNEDQPRDSEGRFTDDDR
jgi:hypothetical protein